MLLDDFSELENTRLEKIHRMRDGHELPNPIC